MSLQSLMRREVTIVRRTESGNLDEYGGDVPLPTVIETVGELQQRSRDEPGDQGEISDTSWLLVLPVDTSLATGDLVLVDDEQFEVVGDPWNANTGSPSMWHVEATLRRTAGSDDEGITDEPPNLLVF